MWPAGTGFLIVQPAQPNVHQGVAVLSQSKRMLRTVHGAPPTDRAVRESTRYFTVLRPPSRSTLNCSWEGKGERACTQGFAVASGPQQRPTSKQGEPTDPYGCMRGGGTRVTGLPGIQHLQWSPSLLTACPDPEVWAGPQCPGAHGSHQGRADCLSRVLRGCAGPHSGGQGHLGLRAWW